MFRLGAAEQVQDQAADRVGRAAAVVEQFRVVGVAFLDDILREGVEQVAEELDRQGVFANHFGERDEKWRLRRRAGCDAVQFRLIGGQAGQPFFGHRIAFVGDVVGAAGKTIDRLDRPTQMRGNEEGGNREVFVVIDGHWPRSIWLSRSRW